MLNKVMLIGRLGHDPKLRQTQGGKSLCTFTLATDSGYGDNHRTDWHNITVFDRAAENCAQYLRKGAPAYVEGRISYDTYEKDGIKRTSTKIIASNVRFLGARHDGTASRQPQDGGYQPPESDDTFDGYPLDEEVPF